MRPVRYKILVLLSILMSSVTTGLCQSAFTDMSKIEIHKLHISDRDISATLSLISEKYSLPIGFEYSESETTSNIRINLHIEKASLKEVLDIIAHQNPGYAWEVNDEVINFVPLKARNDVVKRLLQTRVAYFNPNKDSDKIVLKRYLAELPEVRDLFPKANPFMFNVSESHMSNKKLPDIVLRPIKNVEFRTILNEIVKGNDSKFWEIRGFDSRSQDYLILLSF